MHSNNVEASLQLYRLFDVCWKLQNKISMVIAKMETDSDFIYWGSEVGGIEYSILRIEHILENIRI